jgi:hypothetical protein
MLGSYSLARGIEPGGLSKCHVNGKSGLFLGTW